VQKGQALSFKAFSFEAFRFKAFSFETLPIRLVAANFVTTLGRAVRLTVRVLTWFLAWVLAIG